nr:zinc finger, CCHC-type [Tanacetum cinerariifolium]
MPTRSKSYPINFNATIPRRSNRRRVPNIVEPEIRTIEEVVPMADRTMKELLQAPTEGYGEAIVILEILAENFEIKTNLLQIVQTNKFHEGAARIWYEKEPPNSILTWDDLVNKFVNQFFLPSKTTHLKNEISRFTQRFEETFGEAWKRFKEILRACPHHGFSELTQIDIFYNGLNEQDQDSLNATASVKRTCVICGGAHAYYDFVATDSNQPSVCAATGTYNQVSPPNQASNQIPPPGFAPGFQNQPFQVPSNQIQPGVPNELSSYMKSNEIMTNSMQNPINVLRGDFNKQEENLRRNLNNDMRSILGSFFQNQASTLGTLLSNTVPNPKGEMKAVTTRSGLAYEGPSIPTNYPLEKVVERNTVEITDKEHSNCQGSTAHIQPLVVPISILEPDVSRTQPKPTIPYPSRMNDQKLREKATNQMEKFFQIFHDLHFDISFADALLLMPKFASTIKSLLTNKDKLFELAKVSLNENCSAMLLKKLPGNLGDPEHTPTRMTLKLADRSITRPKGVAEDVFVKVGKFHFSTDFVVVDFEADPRVPLILGRSFLRTGHALINVYGEEITLRVNDESVTFNLYQTMRYSLTYDDNYVNRVDVIDIACEEFVQNVSQLSNLLRPHLLPLEKVIFLQEIEDFLNNESIPTGIKNSFYDPEGDILYLEKFLNEDPFQLLLMDLKQAEETKEKSSIEEPPKLELKELPSHLEYAFLEESNKLPVIIAKDLRDVEKEALIKVLKSHKRAIAWKISNIKGIDPRFCTHKILMEEDYKPAVQSQRRAMAEEDAFLVNNVEGGLCVDYTDAIIVERCNSGSDKNKGKELWDSLESKYMAEDSSSKKFLVSNFNNYKIVDSRPVMEQYNELLRILRQYTQHGLKMDEFISVSSIIDKLPPFWKDFKHTLKHGKDDLSLVQLGSHLRIEESLRAQDSDKGKGKEVDGPSVNMTEEGVVKRTTQMLVVREKGLRTNPKTKVDAIACWIDYGATTHVCKDRCWFKTFEPVEDRFVVTPLFVKKTLEAIDDEIGFIMENNTWVLSDLPPCCKPLDCKWIFKRKIKVDRIVDKFKARLVIQGFRQKKGIDYFDTYAPVVRITTIRLLLALAAIHNLVIHQMDVKTIFLNCDLDEEVYMKQPEVFVMPGNEHKVCKLVKSLYGLKQAPKQWHQKFDEVVLSSGFHLNQSDNTDQNQVDKTKKFLSSRFSMKDMGEATLFLKFNREDCSPVSTPMDPVKKIKLNTGKPVDQLEYSRAIGCLMYAMTSTRPDIAYADGRLSSFTNSYPDASWINHVEDSSSTSVWVFLLGGGAISWASKKQTCITGSTMESEFVALAAAGKEAEWLRNLIHEISIWPKPIAPISIQCDSAPTMARVYSQIYNEKSRHLGVRHSMVRELIRNGVISIEFVRT